VYAKIAKLLMVFWITVVLLYLVIGVIIPNWDTISASIGHLVSLLIAYLSSIFQ